MEAYQQANLRETIAGKIVLSIGCNTKSDSDLIALGELTPDAKAQLDELHKRKIDLADEILVLNVDGYVGASTRSEIEYARNHNKTVRWLESPFARVLELFARQRKIDELSPAARNLEQRAIDQAVAEIRKTHA